MSRDSVRDRRTTRRAFIATVGAGTAATVTPSISAAQTSSGSAPPGGILADGVETGNGDYRAFARGLTSKYTGGFGSPEEAVTLADRMRNEFNANSEVWISYGNWLLSEAGTSPLGTTIVGVDVRLTRGRWPTRDETVETAIEAEYDESTDEVTGLNWSNESPDDPDYQVELRNLAAENAADELQEFRREFIDEEEEGDHEIPDESYISELAGRYSTSISVGDDSRTVLELLLGETY